MANAIDPRHAAELARCLELNPAALRVLAAQGHPIAAGVLKTFEVALTNAICGDREEYEAGYQKRKARRQRSRAELPDREPAAVIPIERAKGGRR